jgi:hypothetical protein
MSEQIILLLPKQVAEALRRRADRLQITLEELIVRACVKVIEEEMKR